MSKRNLCEWWQTRPRHLSASRCVVRTYIHRVLMVRNHLMNEKCHWVHRTDSGGHAVQHVTFWGSKENRGEGHAAWQFKNTSTVRRTIHGIDARTKVSHFIASFVAATNKVIGTNRIVLCLEIFEPKRSTAFVKFACCKSVWKRKHW